MFMYFGHHAFLVTRCCVGPYPKGHDRVQAATGVNLIFCYPLIPLSEPLPSLPQERKHVFQGDGAVLNAVGCLC